MLQAIRDKAQGWIAWAIVILISIPFALWGIQEYLGVGDEPEVAVVDGEPITERMLDQQTREFRENLRASLGDNYRADLFDETVLKQQVLDAMVEERVLGSQAQNWNLRTSDVQARSFISSIPAFQRDGQFDQLSYDTLLRNRGMTRAGFEQSVRQDLSVGQIRAGVQDTVFVTDADLASRVSLEDEKRSFSYARIPTSTFIQQLSADDAQLREYFDANTDRYRTPEQVKLEYLVLDVAGLTDLVELDDDRLRQYFEDHRAEFVAREERLLRHILVAVPPSASAEDKEQAQTKAADLLRQVNAGETDFADLAREHSDDPGSAANGGDLGWVERGMMVAPFEEAAFALAKGEISGLVTSEFGIHIIQVADVRGDDGGDFASLRDEVEAAYRKFEAENLYFDHAERLAEAAYENSSSLTPAAEALGLQVQSTAWVKRNDVLQGPLASPKVINAAFSDDVLVEGHNSELIEVGPQQAVVMRVAEHQPAGIERFDDIKARVLDDYKQDKASEAAAETGKQTIVELESGGKSLQEIAATKSWELQDAAEVARGAPTVPAEVLAKAFSLQPAQDDKLHYGGVVSAEGDYVVIELNRVQSGQLETLPDVQRSQRVEQSVRQTGTAQMGYLTEALRDRTEVELKPIAAE